MELLASSFFWITLGQIMMINIMLSGDNAVVIAMASRALPLRQQKQAILFGSFGAILLRVILTFFAVMLLALPWLKLVGAVLLAYIGVKMLIPDDGETQLDGHTRLWAAIKTIIVADLIMSLDNFSVWPPQPRDTSSCSCWGLRSAFRSSSTAAR